MWIEVAYTNVILKDDIIKQNLKCIFVVVEKKNIQPTIKTKYITKQIKQVNRISKHSYNFYAIDL